MSTHGFQGGVGPGIGLPDTVPFELPQSTRLSWELGSRIVEDDDAALEGEWERTGGSWLLSVFQVTSNTVILRLRTPVGRERFYGAARLDLESALSALGSATKWRRLE